MAAGDKKDDGDNPIDRAMRRKAEAEQAAKTAAKGSVIGSAMDSFGEKPKAPAAKSPAPEVPFEAPKRVSPLDPESGYYRPVSAEKKSSVPEPEAPSFFAPSAEERAEQARRAAQRVRRRARGEEPDTAPIAPPSGLATPPLTTMRPAPAAPATRTPEPSITAQPAAVKPPELRSAPPPQAPKPAAPKIPVLTKAERRLAEKPDRDVDLIARSAEQSAKSAPPPVPSAPAAPDASASVKSEMSSLIEQTPAPAKEIPVRETEVAARKAEPSAAKPSLFTRMRAKAEAKDSSPPRHKVSVKKPNAPDPVAATPAAKTPVASMPIVPTPAPPDLVASNSIAPNVDATISEPVPEQSVYAADVVVVPTSGLKTTKTKAFAPFEWMIASRYLRARKKEGFVSVIAGFSLVGIALGVATLIVVMAVMTGFRETLITQIIGGSPHVNVTSQVGPFENFDTVADQVRRVDGVEYVTPVVQGQVLGTGNQRHTGVIVRGMRKADLERLIETAEPEVINGSLADFVEDKGVALGANLAAKLGLRVGDFITLISPDGDITPFQATPMPRVKDYRIIQTFKLGVQEIDYNVAFMTFGEAQIYFNKQKQADTLDVFVEDAQDVEKYTDPILNGVRSSVSLFNWKNQNGRLIGAINLERQVMFVILTMIILVAALNIISGLVMLVKDKARDVAIMRTMGMARGSILRIFFICGSSIGVIGSLLGVFLGVMFVWNIHSIQGFVEWVTDTKVWDPAVRAGITEIPTKMQFSDVALTLFIALGLSFFATLFPAWKAAKLDPVEALRYE